MYSVKLRNQFFVEGLDASVGKEELRQALMERHRREVEEEVAGINALLFEHVDGDKNGTIELDGLVSYFHVLFHRVAALFNHDIHITIALELLSFIWPSPAEGDVAAVLELRPFNVAEKAVREKILLKMDLPTNASNSM